MPVCVVSFTDTESISHSVKVEAQSLYEAAALALAEFRGSGVTEPIGGAIRLRIEVKRQSTIHKLTASKAEAWLGSNAKSPSERALKVRLREVMG